MSLKNLFPGIKSRRDFLKVSGAGSMAFFTPSFYRQKREGPGIRMDGSADTENFAVGNTPLVQLKNIPEKNSAEIWVKWEGANPTASMKDRMARGMIDSAESKGLLKPGMRIVELTGGSTGSSLAMVGSPRNYSMHFVTTDAISIEKRLTMEALGATLEVIPSHGKGITPDMVRRSMDRVRELASEENTYWINQFNNPSNAEGYRDLGRELLEAGKVDAFVMGVGTGGCISGVGSVLKNSTHSSDVRIVAVEPAASRNLSGGPAGGHQLEGIGLGFIPETARLDLIDEIEAVTDREAFELSRALAKKEGFLAGPTSGANVAVALRVARRLGKGKRVVTLLCDSGLRYLNGNLFKKE